MSSHEVSGMKGPVNDIVAIETYLKVDTEDIWWLQLVRHTYLTFCRVRPSIQFKRKIHNCNSSCCAFDSIARQNGCHKMQRSVFAAEALS